MESKQLKVKLQKILDQMVLFKKLVAKCEHAFVSITLDEPLNSNDNYIENE